MHLLTVGLSTVAKATQPPSNAASAAPVMPLTAQQIAEAAAGTREFLQTCALQCYDEDHHETAGNPQ
jgi:hypothetical protein